MVPNKIYLPDVLPTDRLNVKGMAFPPLRNELRVISNVKNVFSVLLCYVQMIAVIAVCYYFNNIFLDTVAVIFMGSTIARFSLLAHESAHRLLFSNKSVNDYVGKYLLSYTVILPFSAYRFSHFAHHRDELGANEPDMNLYSGYPVSSRSFGRKLIRDLFGISAYKNLKMIFKALKNKDLRKFVLPMLVTQLVILTIFSLTVGFQYYFLLWFLPWCTTWKVINRLRAVAEHAGMTNSSDRRQTTHVVKQHLLARVFMVPFNGGWHLAHHVDMGVPFRNLPKLHKELVESGWITEQIIWPNYISLWRALTKGADLKANQD
jgi:fatty acid desaturase